MNEIPADDPRIQAALTRTRAAIDRAGGHSGDQKITRVTWNRESGKVRARFYVDAGEYTFSADNSDVRDSLERVADEMEAL